MKNILFSLILISTSLISSAQNKGWFKQIGGAIGDGVRDITIDKQGNKYLTGSFRDTVDFDPGDSSFILVSSEHNAVYVLKLDPCDKFLWARSFGGTGVNDGYTVSVDEMGNVYVLGNFHGTGDFDPGIGTTILTSDDKNDIFILKLNSTGHFVWAKRLGGSGQDIGNSMTLFNNNISIIGYFEDSINLDPGITNTTLISEGFYDIFILQIDLNGNIKWAKKIGGTSRCYGNSITSDSKGELISTGYFQGTADFDPGILNYNLTTNGYDDIFISKLDSNGNFSWAKTFGGSNFDWGHAVTTDSNDNILVTGGFRDSLDFNPNLGLDIHSSEGSVDIFLTKLTPQGKYKWTRTFGSAKYDIGQYTTCGKDDNIYVSGYFQDTLEFDLFLGIDANISFGRRDAFVINIDSNGNPKWMKNIGGQFDDYGSSIITDTLGNLYWTGTFQDTLSTPSGWNLKNIKSLGSWDVFVVKLAIDSVITDSITACNSYMSPTGNKWETSGIYLDTVNSTIGCDSIVYIVLTIQNIDTSITINDNTLIASQDSGNYQWLDCTDNFSSISGETNQEYTPTKNGTYAVKIENNGCIDTSKCASINTLSSERNQRDSKAVIYPNPTNSNVFIKTDKIYSSIKVEVFDISGNLIIQNEHSSTKLIYLPFDLQAGYYFIQLSSPENNVNFKVLKCLKL
jgi:hypothetical protein